ncbi:MAG TPA: CHAP domain-containing protein [Rhizomicrobium sp.]|nr:CHAP domain-containing protein [Rhizomicrobium sp.]
MAVLLGFPIAARADVQDSGLSSRVGSWLSTIFGPDEAQPATPVIQPVIQPVVQPRPALTARPPTLARITPSALGKMEPVKVAPPPPSVEKPLRRLFCVEYARMRSGLAIMGDAKYWWARARNLYARLSHPVEEAVMVFSGSKRLRRGHVAVVTDIVSPREIIVDQANWQNHGEIDHAMPVRDVSEKNDWSRVKVWNIHSGQFGTHVYAVSGFIAKDLLRQASAD